MRGGSDLPGGGEPEVLNPRTGWRRGQFGDWPGIWAHEKGSAAGGFLEEFRQFFVAILGGPLGGGLTLLIHRVRLGSSLEEQLCALDLTQMRGAKSSRIRDDNFVSPPGCSGTSTDKLETILVRLKAKLKDAFPEEY